MYSEQVGEDYTGCKREGYMADVSKRCFVKVLKSVKKLSVLGLARDRLLDGYYQV